MDEYNEELINTKSVFLNLDKIAVLEEDDDIMLVDLWLLHTGRNRNKMDLHNDVVEKAIPTFYNKFIVYQFDNAFMPTDVGNHNYSETDTTMNIAGIILEGTGYKWVQKNGKEYLVMVGAISKAYQPMLTRILKRRGGNLKISVEILIDKDEADTRDDEGYIVPSEIRLRGVTLLGKNIEEGIEGSHLDVTKFSLVTNSWLQEDTVKTIECKFSSLFGRTENSSLQGKEDKTLADDTIQVNNSLGARAIEEKIWSFLSQYKYRDGEWEGRKYYIEEVYPEEHYAIIHDNETDKLYKLPYKVNVDGETIDIERDKMTSLKEVIKKESYVEKDHNEHVIHNAYNLLYNAKEFGQGEEIKVDESKEAMSDKPWGEVDKTDLRNKVLDASNYKELVHKVYALVEEGWEEAPSEKLKYPIMEIKGGKAVYNKDGLASALGYAKKEDEKEVISKVEKIRDELDLDEDHDDDDKKISKNSCECDDDDDAIGGEDFSKQIASLTEELNASKLAFEELSKEHEAKCEAYAKLEEKCKVFERAEEVKEMGELIKKYSHCFTEEEREEFSKKSEEMALADFEAFIKEKVCESVAKHSRDEENHTGDKAEEDEDDLEEGKERKLKEEVEKNIFAFAYEPLNQTFSNSRNEDKPYTIDEILEALRKC